MQKKLFNIYHLLDKTFDKCVWAVAVLGVILVSAPVQATPINSYSEMRANAGTGVVNNHEVGIARMALYNFQIFEQNGSNSYDWDVDVTVSDSTLLSGLSDASDNMKIYRQTLTIRNMSSEAQRVTVTSAVDVDMGSSVAKELCGFFPYCDFSAIDQTSQVAYATSEYEASLFATAISVEKEDVKLAYEATSADDQDWFFTELSNRMSYGPADIGTRLGVDLGFLNPFEEITLSFDYLWGYNLSQLPAEFKSQVGVSEPMSIFLFLFGLLILAGRRQNTDV